VPSCECVCVCVCVYILMCTLIYVYVFIYIYIYHHRLVVVELLYVHACWDAAPPNRGTQSHTHVSTLTRTYVCCTHIHADMH
jgi:hypothetical protein